jgi:hypothetical protein
MKRLDTRIETVYLDKLDGHDFVHLAVPAWEVDVFAFLDEYLKR